MKLKKIQCFDAFGEEDWVDAWTDSLKVLIENRVNTKDDGIIYKTNLNSFDNVYFYMTDKLGHTEFFRMNETKFDNFWYNEEFQKWYQFNVKNKTL